MSAIDELQPAIAGMAAEQSKNSRRGIRRQEPRRVVLGDKWRRKPDGRRPFHRRPAPRAHSDHGRVGRNVLAGPVGDAVNALLCGAGYNLRLILNYLADLLRALFLLLAPTLQTAKPA